MTKTYPTVLITGANGGIGNSISKKLLENDFDLILFYNNNKNRIDDLVSDNPNSNISIFNVNLLDEKNIENTMSSITEKFAVDSFIHTASLPPNHKQFFNFDWSEYEKYITIEAKSFFQISQKLIPSMKNQKSGKLISILSSYVVGSPPTQVSPYVVGKYALLGLMKTMSKELASFGIQVNSISPSMTDTTFLDSLPSKMKEIVSNQSPLKRLATVDDISSILLFLCKNDSDYFTGENLVLSGSSVMH